MDILSHALWAAATGKGVNLKSPKKIRLGWMALWGVLPDLFAFTPVVLWMLWQLVGNKVVYGGELHFTSNCFPAVACCRKEERRGIFLIY